MKQYRLTITADKQKEDPAKTTFEIPVGKIKFISIEFPAGCHDMVYVQLLQGNNSIIPPDADKGITGDDFTFPIEREIPVIPGATTFTFKGWAPGTTYPHTITLSINAVKLEELTKAEEQLERLNKTITALSKFLGM